MYESVITFGVGIVCVVLGISNMRGNISSLHSYHRQRVSEEDRIPFGRRVGMGNIIIGISIVIFSAMAALTHYMENNRFILVGSVFMIVGIIVGLVISFRAMIKYNNGIF